MYATLAIVPNDQRDFAAFLEKHTARNLSNGQWNRLFALCKEVERTSGKDVTGYKCDDGIVYNPYSRIIQA